MSITEQPTKLHVSELVDLAYKLASEHFKDQIFSFTSIWSKVWKSATNFSKEKVENWIGYFYVELLNDPRFIIFSFNKWRLKEFMDFDEVRKFEKTVVSDESLFEEDYESYLAAEKSKKSIEVAPEALQKDLDDPEDDSDQDQEDSEVLDEVFEEEV